MKPQKEPDAPLTKDTALSKAEAAKLHESLAPHVKAINRLCDRLATHPSHGTSDQLLNVFLTVQSI